MNLLQRRRAMMGAKSEAPRILPDDYQEVEYIAISKNVADTYLNTGIQIQNVYPTVFQGKFYPTDFGMYNAYSLCIKKYNDSNPLFAVNLKDALKVRNGNNTTMLVNTATQNKLVEFSVTVTNDGFQVDTTIDGQAYTESLTQTPVSWTTSGYHFWLNSDYSNGAMVGRYYYAKVIQKGKVIIDLMPCYRKSDTKIGMYDFVSKSFKPVTGTWTKGPDVT